MGEYGRIKPDDEQNRKLVSNVHPSDWVNPTPSGRYNLVVIGAGTAGLVTAAGAAGLGARVALVERHLMGGDCLNVGYVPSKCIIRSSRAAADVRAAGEFGVKVAGGVEVDFPAVMDRMRRLRTRISANDSAARFRDIGVDVYIGEGRFAGGDVVEVGERKLRFQKAVIATGARALEPSIEGLKEVGFLTNETVFDLEALPKRLCVIGAGPIGCEMAQAFARLGSEVHLLHKYSHVLNREDADAAEIVQKAMVRDGVKLVLDCDTKRVERTGTGKLIHLTCGEGENSFEVDEILIGIGRVPNVDGLNLEGVGVEYDERRGVKVDDRLRTTNSRVFAAGDICMRWKFTHAADAAARIVIANSLFGSSRKLSALTMPWCTYTDPEIAHVGMYEADAKAAGIDFETFSWPLAEVDRAIADGEEEGFAKVHVRRGKDEILGATIVARHAGEMINEISAAMVGKLGLGGLAGVIHPYPTQAEAIKRTADSYYRTRLTPFVKKLFNRWLRFRR
jgi:pyruvate/2-oxoglutarate dehydrogenase complex dihydrolipoamide dehydrogenase (E3) component